MVSVTVPIWLSLISTAFAVFSAMPRRDELRIGDEDVVADDLDAASLRAVLLGETRPVVLVEAVLDRTIG